MHGGVHDAVWDTGSLPWLRRSRRRARRSSLSYKCEGLHTCEKSCSGVTEDQNRSQVCGRAGSL